MYPIKCFFKIKIINSDTPWVHIREYPQNKYRYPLQIRFHFKYPGFINANSLTLSVSSVGQYEVAADSLKHYAKSYRVIDFFR